MGLDFRLDQPISPSICHQSINSRAAVLFEIRKSEVDHWFAGLKKAEGFILMKQDAIVHSGFKLREYSRELRAKQRSLDALLALTDATPEQADEIERLEDALLIAKYHHQSAAMQFRDAQMEQRAAQEEFDRIVSAHPEATALDYDHLQAFYTPIALAESQARWVAARIWATTAGLPGEVGAALFDLPPGDEPGQREYALRREMEIRGDAERIGQVFRAVECLSQVPAEDVHAVLIQAAQAVLATKQLSGGLSNG